MINGTFSGPSSWPAGMQKQADKIVTDIMGLPVVSMVVSKDKIQGVIYDVMDSAALLLPEVGKRAKAAVLPLVAGAAAAGLLGFVAGVAALIVASRKK